MLEKFSTPFLFADPNPLQYYSPMVGRLVILLAMVTSGVHAGIRPGADEYISEREKMVKLQIEERGVSNKSVLQALRNVPRHRFVPADMQRLAYTDSPLPIGHNQTISQPYIVGFMTDAAKLKPTDKVLEIGTGSGYQAAVLAELVKSVYTIEIVEPLGKQSQTLLRDLKYRNIHGRIGDGYKGWPEAAPFDVIFVTAAPDHIPQPLIDQLRTGGRFIIPVGANRQHLIRITKTSTGLEQESLLPVSFVPMTGVASKKK